MSAAEKLLGLRQSQDTFHFLSFATISSFAANGAIIHYSVSPKTNKKIGPGELYLVDSGGGAWGATYAEFACKKARQVAAHIEEFFEHVGFFSIGERLRKCITHEIRFMRDQCGQVSDGYGDKQVHNTDEHSHEVKNTNNK